jgi:tryptophan synthase alpha chain
VNRIDSAFARLRREGRKAFMPFLTAGDPSLDATAAILQELERRGAADVVELGVPFSDPLADGPVIQASFQRALEGRARPRGALEMVQRLRQNGLALPICLMVSYSLVYRAGPEAFADEAAKAGIDGFIVPDLPADEGEAFGRVLSRLGLKHVLLVTPATTPERRRLILARSTGFVYCVSLSGITGERAELPAHLVQYVTDVKKTSKMPVCVGFGISRPEQVAAVARVADGVIVGSAVVRHIDACEARSPEEIAKSVADFCQTLAAPLKAEPRASRPPL